MTLERNFEALSDLIEQAVIQLNEESQNLTAEEKKLSNLKLLKLSEQEKIETIRLAAGKLCQLNVKESINNIISDIEEIKKILATSSNPAKEISVYVRDIAAEYENLSINIPTKISMVFLYLGFSENGRPINFKNPAEMSAENPVENLAETSAQNGTEISGEPLDENPAEIPAKNPAEKLKSTVECIHAIKSSPIAINENEDNDVMPNVQQKSIPTLLSKWKTKLKNTLFSLFGIDRSVAPDKKGTKVQNDSWTGERFTWKQ